MASLVKSLHDMINNLFGVNTVSRITAPLTGAAGAAVQIAPNNPRRLALTIVNLSANVCWVGLSNQVGAANGIWLTGNGGSVTLKWDTDFEMTANEWWSVSVAGGDQLHVMEQMIE